MEYEILFSDVDGTLLDSRHELSPRTLSALRKAHEQGCRIVIASGHCADGMNDVIKHFDFPVSLSTLNGAYVLDSTGRLVSQSPFEKETALEISHLLKKHGMGYLYFSGRQWGSGIDMDYSLEKGVVRSSGLHLPLEEVVRTRSVHKILAVARQDDARRHAFEEEIRSVFPDYMIMPSSSIYMEINTPGTSKGLSVDRLCSYYGIPVRKSVAFGDYDNDISMFRAAGHSVCLANGSSNAMENADEIAPSNDEDGLACWIEANLFH